MDQKNPFAILRIHREGIESNVIDLPLGATLRIGRVDENDIVLADNRVSRNHAIITASKTGILLSDLGSLNGTFVNEKQIKHTVSVNANDKILIGDSFITILTPEIESAFGDQNVAKTEFGELKQVSVTILLADICGFSSISEKFSPEIVSKQLRSWFSNVSEIVEKNGGTVDKLIGDAVMALWTVGEEEASLGAMQAYRAAQEILSLGGNETAPFSFSCRTILNSGEALIGTIGSSGATDFTVIGDTVNVTFRLEDAAKELRETVLLGSETAALLGKKIALKSLGKISVEGREKKIEVFAPKG